MYISRLQLRASTVTAHIDGCIVFQNSCMVRVGVCLVHACLIKMISNISTDGSSEITTVREQ